MLKGRTKSAAVAAGCLAAVCGLALPAAAQFSQGADVIVGDLYEVANYAPFNGIAGYAVGTISCNKGNVPLDWFASTNRHPVIGQTMYRLHNGRFQQIGQGWLKHGFTALQGNACSLGCTAHPDGTRLGVGCSDPYSAGLNGSQTGLGPKSEVNAATGAFPYPYVLGWQQSGNSIYKRLQVNTADLSTTTYPNALYFVGGIYIALDDAAAGNDNNNQSYRRITVSGTNIALAGTTQRERYAIQAWRDNGGGVGVTDPNVILTNVDVPNDGRFIVGARAFDLGGGLWRYEYAVQNYNSDRSGASFSIPIPAGVTVSNIGFSDVAWHSGEPYNGTDWTSTNSGGNLTWSVTQTHAVNPNANALRWDTIYNFWFTANRGPAGGAATLGLFKPGAVSSVNAGTVVPSVDGIVRPLNDLCAAAAALGIGSTPFTTVNATTDGPTEPGSCTIGGYEQIGNDIWYVYSNGNCPGTATISLCGSSFDTKMAVYSATCPTAPGTAIACNDDAACTSGGPSTLQSTLSWTAEANTTYLIRIGGYNGATGTGTITLTPPPGCQPPTPPGNDNCANATWIAAGQTLSGSTALASQDGTANCGASGTTADVWFRYRPTVSGTIQVDTCGSGYDTVLSIHSACGGTQIACNDDAGSGAPCGGLLSYVTFPGTAGTTYWIRVSGYSGATGNYSVRVQGGGGVVPPTNDDCSGRAGIALGTATFDTTGASTDGPLHVSCGTGSQIHNDIWFNYPSQCTGNLTISTCNQAGFDTRIAVYQDSGCTNYDARLLACNDNSASCAGGSSTITIPVVAGTNYTIRVGGATAAARGTGSLTLSCVAPPSCPADWDGNGELEPLDISAFFIDYRAGDADFDGNGETEPLDITAFFNAYRQGC